MQAELPTSQPRHPAHPEAAPRIQRGPLHHQVSTKWKGGVTAPLDEKKKKKGKENGESGIVSAAVGFRPFP